MSHLLQLEADALLLDMDGTLVHSTSEVEIVWRQWCQWHTLPAEPVLAICHGVRAQEVIRAIAPHLNVAEEAARLDALELSLTGQVQTLDGCRELLHSLPSAYWALVTSASHQLAHHRLHAAGLPLPALLIGAEDVTHGKPDPQPYLLAAARLGLAPHRCLVFEDASAGIASALQAGCQVIQVGGEHKLDPAVSGIIPHWQSVSISYHPDHRLQITLPALG